jgi:hypothetical protein
VVINLQAEHECQDFRFVLADGVFLVAGGSALVEGVRLLAGGGQEGWFFGDGAVLAPPEFHVGDVFAEDSLGGHVPEAQLHIPSYMK